ncbi:MAG: serine hydrolase [Bryobacteraceae bacterium]|nr:serine hydrolase [Bryobacteraceae bacterium]
MRVFTLLFLALRLSAIDPAAVDRLVDNALKTWGSPGAAVAIVENGRIVHVKGYGVREMGKPAPVTADSLFEIASTTKAFTALTVALLADEGRLDWDDPVRQHYPTFRLLDPLANENVTVRDLLCHRTGLPRHDALWYRTNLSRAEVIARIGAAQPNKQFRQEYQYQNIMFLTAGELVGKVAGTTWDDFVQSRIFAPLGMSRTGTSYSAAVKHEDRAMPHRKNKDQVSTFDWLNFDNLGGAGAINSSARDLAQWLLLHTSGGEYGGRRIVSTKNLEETYAPQTVIRATAVTRAMNPETAQNTYAMGWNIAHYRGHRILGHAGVLDGFRSRVTLIPETQSGIVVLANLGRTDLPESVTNSLVDLLLNLPAKDWDTYLKGVVTKQEAEAEAKRQEKIAQRTKDTKPAKPLADYTGTYTEPAYGTVEIQEEQGQLRLKWANFTARLEHWHYETFRAKADNPLQNEDALFTLDAAGQPTRLRFLEADFQRKPLK